jgi:NADP-reducing hydrogenase subunit HndB
MKSLAELDKIRAKAKKEIASRTSEGSRKIIVGMATCGIAAGARPVMNALVEELRTRNITDVTVSMTGCIGVCRLEPIIEVYDSETEKTTYVKMDADKAKRVISEHIVNGQICQDLAIGAYEK